MWSRLSPAEASLSLSPCRENFEGFHIIFYLEKLFWLCQPIVLLSGPVGHSKKSHLVLFMKERSESNIPSGLVFQHGRPWLPFIHSFIRKYLINFHFILVNILSSRVYLKWPLLGLSNPLTRFSLSVFPDFTSYAICLGFHISLF